MMDRKKKINRKTFFKWASLALMLPFFKVWQNTVSRNKTFASTLQFLEIETDLSNGIHFFNRVILVKDENGIKLFSSKCTHLGCKINKVEQGELVCPCHGSRYNLDGFPVKGPSVKQLQELNFQQEIFESRVKLRFEI